MKRNVTDEGSAVARVAYLSSHVVLSIQPALAFDSEFSRHLHSYSTARIPGLVAEKSPEVCLRVHSRSSKG